MAKWVRRRNNQPRQRAKVSLAFDARDGFVISCDIVEVTRTKTGFVKNNDTHNVVYTTKRKYTTCMPFSTRRPRHRYHPILGQRYKPFFGSSP